MFLKTWVKVKKLNTDSGFINSLGVEIIMSQSNSDECFLLHQRAYGETSLIIDVFTKRDGKYPNSKGAKKPKSNFLVIWSFSQA